jgi:putative protease
VDLGDRQYLLSPQDLSGLAVLPELVQAGLTCLKIEGRLKTPEYVANVTRVYRQALDRLQPESEPMPDPVKLGNAPVSYQVADEDRYALEMAFSRGLYTGWLRGINNQELVHGRFAKKRGVYLGEVAQVKGRQVRLQTTAPIKPGDGVVFDSGHPDTDPGGRVYTVEQQGKTVALGFGPLDLRRVRVGDKLWKTSDPALEKALQQTYSGDQPRFQQPIDLAVWGAVGKRLVAVATDPQGHQVQVESSLDLVPAERQPLTPERLTQQLGRLGQTPFTLGTLTTHLEGEGMLPVSELNRMRRTLVEQLLAQRARSRAWRLHAQASYRDLLPESRDPAASLQLIVLVRSLPQLQAALEAGIPTLYCELENPAHYRDAVALVRRHRPTPALFIAPPRITKPGEQYILQQVRRAEADGYLVRNYDQLQFFAGERCIGDFSLNVANPITAAAFKQRFGLERLTASYDLNVTQLTDLLATTPPDWLEITIHQHMPMFHMEHCVFCAFLSDGTDFTNCGRPCETHSVKLCDRTGTEHILQADAGCRNTLFNGVAQTGAEFVQRLMDAGARQFRLEFLDETPAQVRRTIDCYQQLLNGQISGRQLWQQLRLSSQLGVTRGTLETRSSV